VEVYTPWRTNITKNEHYIHTIDRCILQQTDLMYSVCLCYNIGPTVMHNELNYDLNP